MICRVTRKRSYPEIFFKSTNSDLLTEDNNKLLLKNNGLRKVYQIYKKSQPKTKYFSELTLALIKLLMRQPASTSDLGYIINLNYKHNFADLNKTISGMLTKQDFFFKMEYPKYYWTLDSDYEFDMTDAYDSYQKENILCDQSDPLKVKYSVEVSNKESRNQLHQYPIIVLLIVMAFQNTREKLLTLDEISEFVQDYMRNNFIEQQDEDFLNERLLKTLKGVIIFKKIQSINMQYWKLSTDIVLANVQQSIDRQKETNRKFQQQFPFFTLNLDDSLIKGHVIINKIMFKIMSNSPNVHFTRNQIAGLVKLEYPSEAANFASLIYDALKKNELFQKLNSNKMHLYTLNRSFYERTFKKSLWAIENVPKFDIYSDETELLVSKKPLKQKEQVLKASENILPDPSKLIPKTKVKNSQNKNKENSFSFF